MLLTTPARTEELPPAHQTPANDFANKYNDWVLLLDVSKPGIIDVREVRAWHEVVKAWHKLEKGVRYA